MFLLAREHRCAKVTPVNGQRRFKSSRLFRLGAATVEFALVAPFVLSLAFASMEFSRLVMIKQALTNSAREGCRVATLATTQSTSDIDSAVCDFLRQSVADPDDTEIVDISITPSNFNGISSGTVINTTVEIRFADVSWFPPGWVGDTRLIGSANMIRE